MSGKIKIFINFKTNNNKVQRLSVTFNVQIGAGLDLIAGDGVLALVLEHWRVLQHVRKDQKPLKKKRELKYRYKFKYSSRNTLGQKSTFWSRNYQEFDV